MPTSSRRNSLAELPTPPPVPEVTSTPVIASQSLRDTHLPNSALDQPTKIANIPPTDRIVTRLSLSPDLSKLKSTLCFSTT
ncbi:unnamed protein product [Protopolystoma xenopodis]|uniref:Uncharacterized protein n=1 Tax=Protopolystoma xenopodis TaxID=117903 RepID=A0A448X915_9PLAT|nr:unnamed protein product [Protopolystoma xenopodis]